ncbi:UDP-N-acetylglucosamine diphosphorylase/glucosamine-1-phosphate N-acetyltransferase [Terribacillus saccharophilus]|jgi:bifunctional UDP-N-acetylglucosamine pyrophosphorylase / glucosamine-1-phosphate N-acetyltransferase|uniref:Bifunctional protein GlmU n=1 Tax=Terribacillus saccharophilus TaxID=361277 RepID=A0A268H8T0_9BACI|nr:bifunctional UDP-N-acetylglucosamine diphosphorylase/glucosamine-1-phosphate N-acetyltransferase GlmU [Terribacillus saccharophilus]PAD33625.1 UDP-N-acetylglucosamine diphosphorylase/glucosamine-1-phosphate N-acetyltransferase [Terribacillus saccharophilus]PAD94448.1 UDP-N-acetylglucosamine diphosphorylase/glucosamine-1-phosphate N-acetyltransferase [Terribacillus saccharophilus]PAD98177.1 UDP-N-acetylglucosamine diphosphorylase/glucosamine-1-phosphate N-acetyltransferase [Terribacillus sacch
MSNRYAVILAAGKGTRMKSKLYKVLHPVMGKPMVQHVTDQLNSLQLDKLITIVGHGAEDVKAQLGDVSEYALQEEQLGTGHAVLQAEEFLKDNEGVTVVLSGDTPLITGQTIQALLNHHEQQGASATVLTAKAPDPAGYGRVIRSDSGEVLRIVEHKDANAQELLVDEINTGTYCFDNKLLFQALHNVSNDNAQGEYYLPDVLELLKKDNKLVTAYQTPDFDETMGVNDRVALSQAEQIMKRRVNEQHMRNGVTIIDPDSTYISTDAVIEQDVTILPNTMILGKTVIKEDAIIGPNSEVKDVTIGSRTVVKQSLAHDSEIGNDVNIGPFAHIRPQAQLGDNVKIGNFVEVKKASIGEGSKVSHLSYIGDAEVGKDVNVGCGTITVNYDGKNKHLTKIEDNAFIGCNANLIAPVTVGEGALVAAGSTITKDVPADALSIARARQENKNSYLKNK